jgi:hypothetical protein
MKSTQTTSYKAVKNLLSKGDTNVKTAKNAIKTYILYMAPADTVAGFNLCPFASKGCKKSCLYSAGRGKFTNVQESRINKSKYWIFDRVAFNKQLLNELVNINTKAIIGNYKVAIRLNGTSDIDHIGLILRYCNFDVLTLSNLYFYDYTKSIKQIEKYLGTSYKLTFSRSESNDEQVKNVLQMGGNVAVVFNLSNNATLPLKYQGYNIINGDDTDLRYFDPNNVIVGLKAKGMAKYDLSGFSLNVY